MQSGWFFGDSFTAGWGLDHHWAKPYIRHRKDVFEEGSPIHNFRQWGYRYQDSTFSKLICSHYRLEHKNFARPGATNEYIINTVWKELPKMKGGDYVVIGSTHPYRLPQFRKGKRDMDFVSLDYDNLLGNGQGVQVEGVAPEEFLKACADYLVYGVLPLEEEFNNYYVDVYRDIVFYLRQKGINAVILSYLMWDYVEGITAWTENSKLYDTVEDGHWSPNGHREVYQMLVQAFSDKIMFLDGSKVLLYQKFGSLNFSAYI